MKVLHIHQDYPDGRDYPYTRAVANLLDASLSDNSSMEHIVLSINRTSNPFKMSFKKFDQGYSLIYWALPLSFIYLPVMWFWAKFFLFKVNCKDIELIHGHTMTTEGLLARYLANKLKKPFVLSVRGGSDSHNINRLKFEKSAFKKNVLQAKHIFWVCHWFQKTLESRLDVSLESKSSKLPNICEIDGISFSDNRQHNDKFFTVLSFHQYKRKGILELITAFSLLKEQGMNLSLDIFGTGPDHTLKTVSDHIANLDLQENVKMMGHLDHTMLLAVMHKYKGMLLPSSNETFGMAYIEALATGNTILYHKNTGVDGYFGSFIPGVTVADKNVENLVVGIQTLEEKHDEFYSDVCEMQNQRFLERFTGKAVGHHYNSILAKTKTLIN